MGQIIFWASWNEWSLPSPLPHVFQTSDLCHAKCFLLLHGVGEPPTYSDLHLLFFLGGFLCLGLPGATRQGWLHYAFCVHLCPSQLPSEKNTCLPIHPISMASTPFSQNNPEPISLPTIHSHWQSWLSPHHFPLEASSIHQTQNVHKERHSPSQSTSSMIEKKSVAFILSMHKSKTRHWWERQPDQRKKKKKGNCFKILQITRESKENPSKIQHSLGAPG